MVSTNSFTYKQTVKQGIPLKFKLELYDTLVYIIKNLQSTTIKRHFTPKVLITFS